MSDSPDDIVGSASMVDGSRVPVTRAEADAIMAAINERDAARKVLMPTSLDALRMMHDAQTRLRDEGWRDGIYCPKDGSPFAVIEFGSTGIFEGFYSGEWPTGYLHVSDSATHPNGHLWKPKEALSEAERALMGECTERERQMTESFLRNMAFIDEVEPRHE